MFQVVGQPFLVRPLMGVQVIVRKPGHLNYPLEPNTFLHDERHNRVYVREDEAERIFEQLRRVSANETPFTSE